MISVEIIPGVGKEGKKEICGRGEFNYIFDVV
jgi:hypothetical protein